MHLRGVERANTAWPTLFRCDQKNFSYGDKDVGARTKSPHRPRA